MNTQQNMQILNKIVEQAADGIRDAMNNADLDNYLNFLNMMYHYTLPSEEKLANAAKKNSIPEVVEFFEHQSKEERGHYVLAQKDLEAFGLQPCPQTPSEVVAYSEFWNNVPVSKSHAYIGAVYIFENVAELLTKEAKGLIERLNLSKVQSRWLRVHLEADLEHGAETQKIAEKFGDAEIMIEGAKQACELWVAIFKQAFEGKEALPLFVGKAA